MTEEMAKHFLTACFYFHFIITENGLLQALRIHTGETLIRETVTVDLMCGHRGIIGASSTAFGSHTQGAFIYIGTDFFSKKQMLRPWRPWFLFYLSIFNFAQNNVRIKKLQPL